MSRFGLHLVDSILLDFVAYLAFLGSSAPWFGWLWPSPASCYPTISQSSSISPHVHGLFGLVGLSDFFNGAEIRFVISVGFSDFVALFFFTLTPPPQVWLVDML